MLLENTVEYNTTGSFGFITTSYRGMEGGIYRDEFTDNDAKVYCRRRGFQYGTAADLGKKELPIWLSNIQCSGKEESLSDCNAVNWGPKPVDRRLAGAFCFNTNGE